MKMMEKGVLGILIAVSLSILLANAVYGNWLGVVIGLLLIGSCGFSVLALRNRR